MLPEFLFFSFQHTTKNGIGHRVIKYYFFRVGSQYAKYEKQQQLRMVDPWLVNNNVKNTQTNVPKSAWRQWARLQQNERVRIPRRERQPQCRSLHRGRPVHTQRMVQLPHVHPGTVRPTERSPQTQNPDSQSRGTQDNAVRMRHVEPARVPLRHAAPSPPQLPDSLHRLAKEQSRQPADFLSGHA